MATASRAYARYRSEHEAVDNPRLDLIMGSLVPIDAYVTLDARAAYRLNSRATLELSGRNLTRSEQRQTAGQAVERSLQGTVTIRF